MQTVRKLREWAEKCRADADCGTTRIRPEKQSF